MLDKIDNTWLHSFICVYERSSFAKASEHLAIPSSNVSRHVQQLETELGNKLFYRTTRKVTPTQIGEALYSKIKEPLYNLNQSLQQLSTAPQSLKGTIRLSSPDIPLIGDILASFAVDHSNITLCCEHSTSIESAVSSDPDVIISFERGTLDERDWVSKPLCEWESIVLASQACIERYGSPKTIDELETLPCISSYKAFGGNPWTFSNSETNELRQLKIKSKINVDGGFIAKASALRGLGFVALPKVFCVGELEKGQLQEQDLDHKLAPLTIYIHYRSINYHSYLTKQLVNFILKHTSS
ncbi:LysR family transcriptional regulator [Photobacterium kishitanii]|uniref:LysR family transcriptional regulator n=1 Tax=Photobacterium kishitanii TaxID=318456 RepID=A0A2T3KJU1_9GAMM|nr:LysR family transcriptional regulator [Photobacterium kishitanii]PSU99773.1 LysR family transcriptional regulator [Photobacterium kishitanii]